MSVGAMRARVSLQEPVCVADEIGGAAIVWTDRGEVWAEIRARGASEYARYDAAVARADYFVTIRRREDVRHPWRVVWANRRFRIVGRADAADPGRLVLFCEEEVL
jgi:SPP1 family predicted phage head-tail adaptor